jgi:hypothetical protein
MSGVLQTINAFLDAAPPSTQLAIAVAVVAIVLSLFLFKQGKNTSTRADDISEGLRREQRNSSASSLSDLRPLNPSIFKPFKLVEVNQASHNTKLLRFEIPGNQV